jgi:hypothetical protein
MKKLIIAAVVTCLALTGTAQAYWWNETTTWSGASSDAWSNSGNWDNSAPSGNFWGGGTNSNSVQWYDTRDGYLGTGAVAYVGNGEQSLYGNNNPGEFYLSGDAQVASDFLNLQVRQVHMSGTSTWDGNSTYISRNGGWLNGAGVTNGIDGSGFKLTDSASLNATTLAMSMDAGFSARLILRDSSSASADTLTVGYGNTGAAKVTVSKNASLDVSGNMTVNADAYVQTAGAVTVDGTLTLAGGLVYVGGGSWTLAGDQTTAMAAAQVSGYLIATVALNGGGDTVLTPEPATMCLLAVGGLGALLRRRRR